MSKKKFVRYISFVSIALAGCSPAEPIRVLISPVTYQVGEIRSNLATPVVDEVIKLSPNSVQIVACAETPPKRIIQFREELVARHAVELILRISEEGCID